jgi:hypothetical protein
VQPYRVTRRLTALAARPEAVRTTATARHLVDLAGLGHNFLPEARQALTTLVAAFGSGSWAASGGATIGGREDFKPVAAVRILVVAREPRTAFGSPYSRSLVSERIWPRPGGDHLRNGSGR